MTRIKINEVERFDIIVYQIIIRMLLGAFNDMLSVNNVAESGVIYYSGDSYNNRTIEGGCSVNSKHCPTYIGKCGCNSHQH